MVTASNCRVAKVFVKAMLKPCMDSLSTFMDGMTKMLVNIISHRLVGFSVHKEINFQLGCVASCN